MLREKQWHKLNQVHIPIKHAMQTWNMLENESEYEGYVLNVWSIAQY